MMYKDEQSSKDAKEAINGITSNMTLMVGGFGLCGIPENCISALVELGANNLTCISNNAGVDDFGWGYCFKKSKSKNDFFLCRRE